MNDDGHLVEALRQIKAIVDGALAGKTSTPGVKLSKLLRSSVRRESLPDHILELREGKFFAQPKTFNEVHSKLEATYPCDTDRVKVACMRLQRRKELRKTTKLVGSKSKVAYVW
jgi:hypothetical protein